MNDFLTQTLVREHDNILRMLDVIHRACLSILDGAAPDVPDFTKMVGFIRSYADKAHHGKEEEFLFTVMAEELGGVGENLTRRGMMVEHDIGRLYVSDLASALEDYQTCPSTEVKLSILVSAGSYERLLRRHIQKENQVIFPYGQRTLSRQSWEALEEQARCFEADKQNTAGRKEQLAILDELEKKYG